MCGSADFAGKDFVGLTAAAAIMRSHRRNWRRRFSIVAGDWSKTPELSGLASEFARRLAGSVVKLSKPITNLEDAKVLLKALGSVGAGPTAGEV